jgi:fructose 1,6-bisphosphate aldolase/phosphatase
LIDAPSGNLRGAGPGVAEIEFDLDFEKKSYRRAEAFLIFAADKCSPGAYNYPLYSTFCDPMRNTGLLLNPKMHEGFVVTVMDMDSKEGDRVISLSVPEENWKLAALLQNSDRFAIESIQSRHKPNEQVVSASTTRLHNIAGKYTGKDDPIMIMRTQGIFPAPEEAVEPWTLGHFVTGDCRGSHVMPIMPVAKETSVTGMFCLPIVSCLAFSMNKDGKFSREVCDIFGGGAWDEVRTRVQAKAYEWRRQGFVGPTMASQPELAYTGIKDVLESLAPKFLIRR